MESHDITVLYFSGTLSTRLYVENRHDVKTSENRTRFKWSKIYFKTICTS